jgi:predicted transcriptional regulator
MPDLPALRPTAAELDLLRVLWLLGPADAKQVHGSVLQERPDTNYATVLRQLQVMHAKGLVTRDESQRPQRYAPAQTQGQEKLQKRLLTELIGKAFAGSGKALVLAALKNHVSARERADIQKLLCGGSRAC